MDKVNLAAAFARITEHWRPRVIAELNGQEVKIAKFRGEFVWHHHADADELFLVVRGPFCLLSKRTKGTETFLSLPEEAVFM